MWYADYVCVASNLIIDWTWVCYNAPSQKRKKRNEERKGLERLTTEIVHLNAVE